MSKTPAAKMIAADPQTGRHLRAATAEETAAYMAQPARAACFRVPVLVGAVLIEEGFGPGVWFGGAGL